uniref:histone acetyltransferase n=2 Tax=Oryza glumipatula TaxID=40148 RepID=A0A0E0B1U4_9ORYZ
MVPTDAGVEANECMKVFIARNPDEAGSANSTSLQPFDLNHFFGEDGKIYGYKNLKINVWISAISFHAYADISFEETSDESQISSLFFRIAGLNCFPYRYSNVVTDGNVIKHVELQGAAAFLYCRLVPLILLLVEGSTPIDITEHGWEMLLVVKKSAQASSSSNFLVLGFAAVHHFYHYPESTRLRISQILVLPPYQGEGHGLRLLETINSISESENIYDVTIEDPSDYLQYIRSSIDCLRLLTFDPIKPALCSMVSSLKETNLSKRTSSLKMVPPSDLAVTVRQKLKINKKQFLRCWEILIYLNLDAEDRKTLDNFRACIYDCIKGEILGTSTGPNGKRLVQMPSNFDEETCFAVYWTQDGGDADDQTVEQQPEDLKTQEQQLNEVVDSQMEEIVEVAKNVTSRGKDKLSVSCSV